MKQRREITAALLSYALLGAGLYVLIFALGRWAVRTFAQPMLGSALLSVCEAALFLIVLCLAAPLSILLRGLLGRIARPR